MRASRAAVALVVCAFAGPVAISAPPAEASGQSGREAALDLGNDVRVDRAFVPSAARPQGEVRIVRRGGRAVVQTLLYTRVLKRVFSAIAEKERRNWPAGASEHGDMERYLAALEEFRRVATARRGDAGAGAEAERRVRALIEFIDDPDTPLVVIGGVEIDGAGEAIQIRGRPAPAVLELSLSYIRRNMPLIVADAFHTSEAEAVSLLARTRDP